MSRRRGRRSGTSFPAQIDGFICACGTGGTLAGVGIALKARNEKVRIGIADPMGAALYAYYTTGELKASGSSITEGIGQGRVTGNLVGRADRLRLPDHRRGSAAEFVFDLAEKEGLLLGGSSGINVAGAIRLARELGPGKTIVTVLCDGGARYASKLYDPEFLRGLNLPTPKWLGARETIDPGFV